MEQTWKRCYGSGLNIFIQKAAPLIEKSREAGSTDGSCVGWPPVWEHLNKDFKKGATVANTQSAVG